MSVIRKIPFGQLTTEHRLFVPEAFAAYTVDEHGVCHTMIGPEIQGSIWQVLLVEGTDVHARNVATDQEVREALPEVLDFRVTIIE